MVRKVPPAPPGRGPGPGRATAPLYVRLPIAQAAALDQAAFALRAPKQALVAGLVARYVDPESDEGLESLRELAAGAQRGRGEAFGFGDRRRITVETEADTLTVGRHAFRPAGGGDVLTLAQLAELLQVEADEAERLAESGELQGRRIAGEWRFARQAVIDWLAAGSPETPDDER